MKVRDALKMLKRMVCAWSNAGQPPPVQASDKAGRVTVAGKPSDDLPPGTLNSIMKQSGLKG